MTRTRNVTAIALLCLAVWTAAPALMMQMSQSDIVAQSDLIVAGSVVKTASHWNQDHSAIYTDATIFVTDCQKDVTHSCGVEVIVRVPGGEVGEIGMVVEDMPRFEVGEQATLHLAHTTEPGIYSLVGGWQGKTGGVDSYYSYSYSGLKRIPASCSYYINSTLSDWSSAIQSADAAWDGAGSRFRFNYAGSTTKTAPVQDGYNVMYKRNLSPDTTTIAYNQWWAYTPSKVIFENDIVFNTYFQWSTTGQAGKMDVQNIATHEMGHSLLLNDLTTKSDSNMTMYAYSKRGETKKRSLETPDKDGIKYIYDRAPTAPSNLSGSRSGKNVTLTWRDNSDNEDSFKLERKRGSGGTYAQIAAKIPNTTSHADNNLTGGYTYYYRVRARNGSYYSSYSNEWSVYVPTFDGPEGDATADGRPGIAVSPSPLTGEYGTLRYILPAAGNACVRIYDISGKLVAQHEFAGRRVGSTQLDLHRLSAGVYLLRLDAGNFSTTREMVKSD
ncbi:MAG: T9SS type A sorting domain-containing protein [candidate division WOR-3 bacterium]|nr:T9SS type A sorting domain-containing protein [candidate division WOR-3 bacterium]